MKIIPISKIKKARLGGESRVRCYGGLGLVAEDVFGGEHNDFAEF